MTRDSQYSYIHMKQPNHILFMEKWEVDMLPFDDIEINPTSLYTADNLLEQFLQAPEDTDNDLNIVSGNNPMFTASKLIKRNKKPNWNDLGLNEFMDPKTRVPDKSILSKPDFYDESSEPIWRNPDDDHINSFDFSNQLNSTNDDFDDDDGQDINSDQILIDESFLNRNQNMVSHGQTNNTLGHAISERVASNASNEGGAFRQMNIFATANSGYRSISNPQLFRHSSSSANTQTPQRNIR